MHNNQIAEEELAEQLFGAIQDRPAPGGFQPDFEEIRETYKNPESTGSLVKFCIGCGLHAPINRIGTKEFINEERDNWEGYYLQVDRCTFCNPEGTKNPILKTY